ncbi:unnamed protein product [Staurois parvus]|uniref:Uncharacterized protein n=1 Tax=Staurois parvus TaxID=386267 RepID=A0ABN9BST2_9NEOB|nr:unnamed protein product [Staurois parvus]
MGPRTDCSCCCHARNLSWAPVPASSCCCQVQSVSWVPVRPPIAAVSIATTLPCATFRSPHTAGGFPFCVIGCCMASHCCCLHHHTVAPHSDFGPVDCPNE